MHHVLWEHILNLSSFPHYLATKSTKFCRKRKTIAPNFQCWDNRYGFQQMYYSILAKIQYNKIFNDQCFSSPQYIYNQAVNLLLNSAKPNVHIWELYLEVVSYKSSFCLISLYIFIFYYFSSLSHSHFEQNSSTSSRKNYRAPSLHCLTQKNKKHAICYPEVYVTVTIHLFVVKVTTSNICS